MGLCCEKLGKHPEALEYYQQALAIYQKLYGAKAHPAKATALSAMGLCCENLGKYTEALKYYQQVFMMYQVDEEGSQSDRAATLSAMGLCCEKLGKHPEALEYYHRALQIRKAFHMEESVTELVLELDNVGRAYYNLGKHPEALEYFRIAFEMCQVLHREDNHPAKAAALSAMGLCCKKLGKYAQALKYYQQALEIYQELYRTEVHPAKAAALRNMGLCCEKLGKYAKALEQYQQVRKIYQKLGDVDKIAQMDDAIKVLTADALPSKLQEVVGKFTEALATAHLDNIQIKTISIYTIRVYLLAWLVASRLGSVPLMNEYSQKAADGFQQAIRQTSDGVKAALYTTYGNFLLNTGKTGQAYDYLSQAIESGDEASELYYSLQQRLTATPVLQAYISQQKNVSLRGIDYAYYLMIHYYENFQKAGIVMSQTREAYLAAYRKSLDQRQSQPKKAQEDKTAYYLLGSLYKAQENHKAAAVAFARAQ